MATNHTENYALNLWEPQDDFLREEFNENTQKIDAALKAEADTRAAAVTALKTAVGQKADAAALNALTPVFGSYIGTKGDGQDQHIVLGFRPRLVFFMSDYNFGAKMDGCSVSIFYSASTYISPNDMKLTDDGFIVAKNENNLNNKGITYRYIAFH